MVPWLGGQRPPSCGDAQTLARFWQLPPPHPGPLFVTVVPRTHYLLCWDDGDRGRGSCTGPGALQGAGATSAPGACGFPRRDAQNPCPHRRPPGQGFARLAAGVVCFPEIASAPGRTGERNRPPQPSALPRALLGLAALRVAPLPGPPAAAQDLGALCLDVPRVLLAPWVNGGAGGCCGSERVRAGLGEGSVGEARVSSLSAMGMEGWPSRAAWEWVDGQTG